MSFLAPLWLSAAVVCPLAMTAAAVAGGLPPTCSAARDGIQVCMTGQICTCAYDPGGTLAGRKPSWRWSCSIMQTCDTAAPAGPDAQAAPPWPGPLYVTPNLTPPLPPR
jgi:hypothetical protein